MARLLAKVVHACLESRLPCNHMIGCELVPTRGLHVHVGALGLVHEGRAGCAHLDLLEQVERVFWAIASPFLFSSVHYSDFYEEGRHRDRGWHDD